MSTEEQDVIARALESKKLDIVPKETVECDRLTAQVCFVHEHCGGKPTRLSYHICKKLEEVEQPYQRRIKIESRQPIALDRFRSDIPDPGFVVLRNTAKPLRSTDLKEVTAAARLATAKVYLGKYGDREPAEAAMPVLLRPQGIFVAEFVSGTGLFICTAGDVLEIEVTAFPR